MDESGNGSSGWSWEDNKLFEIALAVIDEGSPERWKEVSSMIGGTKSAEEVEEHYEVLLKDLNSIESGSLDHELDACLHDVLWEDEDDELSCSCFSDNGNAVINEVHVP